MSLEILILVALLLCQFLVEQGSTELVAREKLAVISLVLVELLLEADRKVVLKKALAQLMGCLHLGVTVHTSCRDLHQIQVFRACDSLVVDRRCSQSFVWRGKASRSLFFEHLERLELWHVFWSFVL